MPNILLEVAYNGKDFYGWQWQPDKITVQEVLEKKLSKLFVGQKIKLSAAGRTDSGVSANGQIVSFFVENLYFDMGKLLHFLNRLVGKYIEIKDARVVRDNFHATYGAKKRVYCYRISRDKNIFLYNVYHEPYFEYMNIKLIEDYMEIIKGEHDFFTFSNSKLNVKNFICNVIDAKINYFEDKGIVEFWFESNRFLYNMIRKLVGTMLYLSRHNESAAEFRRILESKDRQNPGGRIPSCGLTLEKVYYDNY